MACRAKSPRSLKRDTVSSRRTRDQAPSEKALTLSVQEVCDGNRVLRVGLDGLSPEDLLDGVELGTRAHVLLAKRLDVVADVGVLLQTMSFSKVPRVAEMGWEMDDAPAARPEAPS